MIDAADRRRALQGYRFSFRGEVLHIWPDVELVVVERDGEAHSLKSSSATRLPLTDGSASFLAEVWAHVLRRWRRT